MKSLLVLMWLCFFCVVLTAQESKVDEKLTMNSAILNMDRNYAIYLPPGYETNERSYPVLYLLHGYGDDQTGWVQFGEVQQITDRAIEQGSATPMIIVMPSANEVRKGYFNSATGDWQYEDFFFKEFMPEIERSYRIKQDKRYRAIAGLSMGGGGSVTYALHHPELFSACCPLSAVVYSESQPDIKRWFGIPAEGDYTEFLNYHNPIYLVENMPNEKKKEVRWYIDCGDDDFLFEGNSLLHIAMRKAEIPHEFRIRDGGHNWTYWRSALPEVLHFVTQSFHQF